MLILLTVKYLKNMYSPFYCIFVGLLLKITMRYCTLDFCGIKCQNWQKLME